MTRAGWVQRRVAAWFWTIRSVAVGRLYFEDGTSEKWPRSFVWSSLCPRPGDRLRRWAMRLFPSWVESPGCGCVIWRGRRQVLCSDHLLGALSGDPQPLDSDPIGPESDA